MAKITGKYVFDDALTMAGFGIYNIYLFFAIGGFLMCVIVQTMSMMFIMPAAKCDLELNLAQQGLLSSISFFGVVASSHTWGFFADSRGRKNVLIASLLSSFIASSLLSIIQDATLFIVVTFINGVCVAGSSSIIYAYIGEFHNDLMRPKIVAGVSTFVALGNMYLPGFAWVILPYHWTYHLDFLDLEFRPWRLLLLVYAAPSLFFTVLFAVLPESPKFLLTRGKTDEVLDILRTMYSFNTREPKENFCVTEIIWDDLGTTKSENFLKTLWKQTAPVLRYPLLLKTLGVSLLQFGIFASTSGMIMWYPTILNTMSHFVEERPNDELKFCKSVYWEQSLDVNTTEVELREALIRECRDDVKSEVFLVSLVIGFVYCCMYIFIAFLINTIGPKNLLCAFVITGTTAGIISQYAAGYQIIQIMMGIFIIGGVEVSIVNAIVVDLFPTQVRAMALALSLMFGRLGAMTGTNIVGPLIYNWCDYVFYVFTIDHIILLIILFLLPRKRPSQKIADDSV